MEKVILITGVSSGFGRETALLLAQKGYKVYGSVRREIAPMSGIHLVRMDVTDVASVKNAVQTIVEKEGHLDILINNAGMGISGAMEETSQDELHLQINTNFYGVVNTTQAVMPFMRKQKNGTIINISSIGGLMGLPFQGFYSASKFAIEGYSEALRMEVKQFNIKVVVINPGDFATGFTANRKLIAVTNRESVYKEQFTKTIAAIEKDETTGLKPIVLAQKIASVLEKKNPANRYVVASPVQKLSVILKSLLPGKWFARMIEDYYGIK
jgi:NAD(P)-dependent dehydrogenase (short-subunit alcohol dehydrogenase family)